MEYDKDKFKIKYALSFPLYLTSKELIRKYNSMLQEYDLTYTQFLVMLYFWEQKESNLKEIGKIMILDSSTLTPLLKKLEKKGYLTRKKSKDDERNLVIKLTKKGIDLREKLIDLPEKFFSLLNLTDEELNQLQNILYKILSNVIKEEKE